MTDIFDPAFYVANHPEVAPQLADFNNDPFQHFQEVGQFAGLAPSEFFDPAFYLAQNPDVAAQFGAGGLSPVNHFILYGEFERRSPNPDYSEIAYLVQNPEVVDLLNSGQFATGAEHFLKVGQGAGLAAAF